MTTATKATFTPGPWVVSENKRERTIQVDTADGRGTVVQPNGITWIPDARLIAAAPDMRWLIERLASTLTYATRTYSADVMSLEGYALILDEARALLAKIEGR